MSPLRIIGYTGLAVISVASLLTMYVSLYKGDWTGVAFGVGALVLVAFLSNYLWLSGRKHKDPNYSGEPNQTILGLLLTFLGVIIGAAGMKGLVSNNWLAAFASLLGAVLLLYRAYRALSKRI
jgi:hypothetical protein